MQSPTALPILDRATINPASLDAEARHQLIDELYPLQQRVFAGVSRESFAAYTVESSARYSRILVLRASARVVGYLAFHLFEHELDGHRHLVIRLESGYDPMHRGRSKGVAFFARELLRTCLRHPLTPKHMLGCYVHPTAYMAMNRVAPLWPRPETQTPAAIAVRMVELAHRCGLEPVRADDPGIRAVGWITREPGDGPARWREHPNACARFFVQRNPGYVDGQGLLVYARMSLLTVARGLGVALIRGLRKLRDAGMLAVSDVGWADKVGARWRVNGATNSRRARP